jgi:hypothetical protein
MREHTRPLILSADVGSVGIEKIIPGTAELAVFIRLLTRSATGERITQYTSHFAQPHAAGEMHIMLVDNGRSARLADERFSPSLKCIRCGAVLGGEPAPAVAGGRELPVWHHHRRSPCGPFCPGSGFSSRAARGRGPLFDRRCGDGLGELYRAPSRGGRLRRLGPCGAGGVEQPGDLGDVHVGQIPHVGDQLAVGDKAEVEPVVIARHGDVEALPVGDDRHRKLVTQLGPGEVQRLTGPGNVGDPG